jgi:hypothetical protein
MQGTNRQGEMAHKLGEDRSSISRDLKVLQERWKEAGVRDLDVAKGEELERIDHLDRTDHGPQWRPHQSGHPQGRAARIGFDGLTQFEGADYRSLFSRLRRLESSRVPLPMRAASYAGGIGHD